MCVNSIFCRDAENDESSHDSTSLRASSFQGNGDTGETIEDIFIDEDDEDSEEPVLPIEYEELPEEVLVTTQEVKIKIAADSGAVDHIANPANVPSAAKIRTPENGRMRNFVAANGDSIKNHGQARVKLETSEGFTVGNVFQVADVCRPLHSVSKVCDTGHEWLFTAEEAMVVPAGALSKFLKSTQPVARDPREGGLYVATMTAKVDPEDLTAGFTRPGPTP